MKQRKLFAILTLVAFMMTLLPMAAFADESVATTSYSAANASVSANKVSIDVYKEDARKRDVVELTLRFRDLEENDIPEFIVKSSRDAEMIWFETFGGTPDLDKTDLSAKLGATVDTLKVDDRGRITLFTSSDVTGQYTLDFYKPIEASVDDLKEDAILFASVKITVKAAGDGEIDYIEVEGFDTGSGTKDAPYEVEVGEELTITARIVDGNVELVDEKVLLKSKYKGGSWVTIDEQETDKDGEVEFEIIENRSGAYQYRVELAADKDVKEEFYVNWGTTEIDSIKADKTDIKVEVEEEYAFKFLLKDAYGNKVDKSVIDDNVGNLELRFVKLPSDSDLKDEDVADLSYETKAGEIKVTIEPDVEGLYEIQLRLDSRTLGNLTFEAMEYGETESIKVELADDFPAIKYSDGESVDGELEVTLVDENGVERDVDSSDSDITFSSSNPTKVKVNNAGELTVLDDDFTGKVVITVFDKESKVSANLDVFVVGEPAAIDVKTVVNGLNAVVTMQLVDEDGNATFAGEQSYDLILPSGVSSEDVEGFDAEEGEAEFDLVTKKAGTYNVTVVVNELGIAKTFSVAFDAPKADKPGAGKVTLFIGQQVAVVDGEASVLDVAPFIKDGRTFVPVRFIAEALGAEVKYDAATQVVTATRGDDVVVLTIGSNVMTVNGEAQVTDVAPFIVDGRTVLPFRALAEAFGSEVAWDAATQSVVFEK